MTIIKRAILSMMRKPGKSLLIFLSVFFLSLFLSIGMSTSYGIEQTEMNLRARFPAIATLIWEFRSDAYRTEFDHPTMEMIEAVGALPYVRAYDFKSRSSLYATLEWAFPAIDVTLIPEEMTVEEITSMQAGQRERGGWVNMFHVMGVNRPDLIDMQANLISLYSGRLMTEAELESGAHVAIISRSLAEVNHLNIGSTIALDNLLFDYDKLQAYASPTYGMILAFRYWHRDEFRIAHQPVELEVIGIFDVERGFLYPDDFLQTFSMTLSISEIYNRIYIPATAQMPLVNYLLQHDPTLFHADDSDNHPLVLEPLFLLEDPRDIDRFIAAAHDVLPEHWYIEDTSAAFAPFISAMDSMLWIADLISRGAFISTIAALCLLFTLLMYERRHEIGIYRSLGESSLKTTVQLLTEVTMISLVAMTFALFIGNQLANHLGRNLLMGELMNQAHVTSSDGFNHVPFELFLFTPEPMSIEEMMIAFDPSLNIENTRLFFIIQLTGVLLSTGVAIIYVMRLKIKDILL
ncbi:MAG: ABC transporter permease [Defluviitaleaceae bacterium]|nr:ABC transporter permease [Defluviitaleaceae bacterium]